MKDGKYEVSDFTSRDHYLILLSLLVDKGIVSTEEINDAQNALLTFKNEQLEKDPEMKRIFEMFTRSSS